MDKDYLVIGIVILILFASATGHITNEKNHEAEIAVLRSAIASFTAQKVDTVRYKYKYTSPVNKLDKLTSPFGYRELLNPFTGGVTTGKHMGVDMVGRWHCEIFPIAQNGEVIDKWYPPNGRYKGNPTFGGYVRIRHNDGWISAYGHLSVIYVKEGDVLKDGLFYRKGKVIESKNIIGRQGNTGMSTGQHLHLSIQKPDGVFVNPLRWVKL